MQPVSAFSSVVRAPRLRLEEPVGTLNSYLIEKLSRAAAPLVVAAIARDYLTEQGLVANKPTAAKWTHRLRQRLRVLEKHGIAATVHLSGRNHQGWVLAERMAELSPLAQPLESPHQDNDVIFAELNRASRALTLTDLCRAVLRANGEQPISARLQKVRGRLQPCLRRHRDRGVLSVVRIPGSTAYGWLLSGREAELGPQVTKPRKIGPFDAEIRAAMEDSSDYLSINQIAARLHNELALPEDQRGLKLRTVTRRVEAFMREHWRHNEVRPVTVKGKRRCWQLVAPASKEASSACADR